MDISPRDGRGDSLLLVLFTSKSLWPMPASTNSLMLVKDATCELNGCTLQENIRNCTEGEKSNNSREVVDVVYPGDSFLCRQSSYSSEQEGLMWNYSHSLTQFLLVNNRRAQFRFQYKSSYSLYSAVLEDRVY